MNIIQEKIIENSFKENKMKKPLPSIPELYVHLLEIDITTRTKTINYLREEYTITINYAKDVFSKLVIHSQKVRTLKRKLRGFN